METNITTIRKLVGEVTEEQLRYVDCFVSEKVALFMPSVGPCLYAISPSHVHPSYSFVLAFDDYCQLVIGDKIISSEHGKICALSPGVSHHEVLSDGFSRYVAIFIDIPFFESQMDLYPNAGFISFNGESLNSSPELSANLKDFMTEYEEKLPGYKDLLEAIGLRITHQLIRQSLHCSPSIRRGAFLMQVDNVIEFLHSHYDKKTSVASMAEMVSLSPSHFSRVFKRETGKPPLDYLIQIRLEKSRKLLRLGEKSITEVAGECGFHSSAHFSSCFYRKYKMSPSDYKAAMQ